MKRSQLDFSVKNVAFSEKSASEMEVNCLLMYSGEFVDAGGLDVNVKPALLHSLANRYMNYLETPLPGDNAIKKFFGKAPERLYRPISLDHSKDDALKIIGRVMALEVKEDESDAFLFGKMKILGSENVERVKDGRLSNVSISFDYDEMSDFGDLIEISYVFDGAVPGAHSFGKPIQANKIEEPDAKRVDMGKIAVEMSTHQKAIKQLDIKLNRLYNMKKVYDGLDKFVKDGLISRADMKRLSYDVSHVDLRKYEVYLRAIKTVAMSKKHVRGRVSNNMQMNAFSSFVDSLVENGGKMEKGINVGTFIKNVTSSLKNMSTKNQVNASSYQTDSYTANSIKDDSYKPSMDREQKHEEAEHLISFKVEDLERLGGMVYEGKGEEAIHFMNECAGMEFKFGSESDEDADDEEESKAEADPEARDYSKNVATMNETIKNLSKEITEHRAIINTLNETLIKMSTEQPKEK